MISNALRSSQRVLVSLAAIAAVVGVYTEVKKGHQVRAPYAVMDVTGDGVKDVVVITPYSDGFDQLAFHDGRLLKTNADGSLYQDSDGNFYSMGGSTPVFGATVRAPKSGIAGRTIVIGDFDNGSGLDVIIRDVKENPSNSGVFSFDEQNLPNVFPEIK